MSYHNPTFYLDVNIYRYSIIGLKLVIISSWVLASIILDTFHGALSPGVQYNGHNLIIIISISGELHGTKRKKKTGWIRSVKILLSINIFGLNNQNETNELMFCRKNFRFFLR